MVASCFSLLLDPKTGMASGTSGTCMELSTRGVRPEAAALDFIQMTLVRDFLVSIYEYEVAACVELWYLPVLWYFRC